MVRIKNIRLKYNDYHNGWYFITIVTDNRKKFLEKYKNVLISELKALFQIEGCVLDYHIIMSDHLHLIIGLSNSKLGLGEIIRRFKAKSSKNAGIKLWQPNYYEHGIRNEAALERIREYIINNPAAEILKFEKFYK